MPSNPDPTGTTPECPRCGSDDRAIRGWRHTHVTGCPWHHNGATTDPAAEWCGHPFHTTPAPETSPAPSEEGLARLIQDVYGEEDGNPPTLVVEPIDEPGMAGWADRENNRIVVEPECFEEYTEADLVALVLHEIAHFLCPGTGHGNSRFWVVLRALAKAYGDEEVQENSTFDEWSNAMEAAEDVSF